ncbi:gibberellin-regulated protein 12-like [Herrania umbratica]|uniref:Gibberellin-regulated protein 12-like n=1 Tax=Herrania umbratica TaxID=108875 RepID=A0A6J1AWW9_9ROSI|nr:gibberellin-regulated protein 12-like [Herrania umbratica]
MFSTSTSHIFSLIQITAFSLHFPETNLKMARLSWAPIAFLLFLALAFTIQTARAGGEGSLKPEECEGACEVRCSATSHKKPCLYFCNYCCDRCLCVPSGTSGNREECPCYNNIKTKEGANKCP